MDLPDEPRPTMNLSFGHLKVPAAIASAVALCFSWHFRAYLPITDGWARIETILLPLSSLDLAFHEAGHWIFGIFGWEFLMIAGGTIMQLAMPVACLLHFLTRENYAGVGFTLFWLGENLINISLYAADAKLQALILITGMSGREGGMHDWGYMFGAWGLTNDCIGIAQIIFFCGCWLMVFTLTWAGMSLWERFWSDGTAGGS